MKKLNILVIIISTIVLASCASSSDVVDGGLFQKRKYNKGFFVSKKSKIDSPSDFKETVLTYDKSDFKNKKESTFAKQESDTIAEAFDNTTEALEESSLSENNVNSTDLKIDLADSKKVNEKELTLSHNINEVKSSNRSKKITKMINNQLFSKSEVSSSSETANESILNLILAVLLVVAIIMLLSFIDGALGGLLSLVLLIVIIILLLRYFGVV